MYISLFLRSACMSNFVENVKNLFGIGSKNVQASKVQLSVPTLDMNKSVIPDSTTPDVRDAELKGNYNDLVSAMNELSARPSLNSDILKPKYTLAISDTEVIEVKPKSVAKSAAQPQSKPEEETPKYTKYTIKAGDTFNKVAKNTPGVTVKMVVDANPGVNPSNLKVGQVINVPVPKTETSKPAETSAKTVSESAAKTTPKTTVYTVKKGDTLWQIAQDYNITVAELKKANNMKDVKYLSLGQKLVIPEPVFSSNMKVDESKTAEYKNAIANMMKAKGVENSADIEKISSLITKKAIDMKVDPVLIAGIVGQEIDFRYMSDNIWGVNGKGMMQLTQTTVFDLYRCKPGVPDEYRACKDEIQNLFKKYPKKEDLYNAICKKSNYELNLEVGIIIFKAKLELDYTQHPERSEKSHIENAVRNYNGNVKKKASGVQIRDEYRDKIMANVDAHKVS